MFITHISHERVEMLGVIGVMVLQNEMAVNCGRFSRVRVHSGDPTQQFCNLALAVIASGAARTRNVEIVAVDVKVSDRGKPGERRSQRNSPVGGRI
jgi:hypothetical protein